MKFSSEKQSYLSHKIVDRLLSQGLVTAPKKETVFEVVKQGFYNFIQEWEELEQEVIKRIQSLQRNVTEGSSEWEVLYQKSFEELFRKKSKLFVKK